jgi:hypothetical protein
MRKTNKNIKKNLQRPKTPSEEGTKKEAGEKRLAFQLLADESAAGALKKLKFTATTHTRKEQRTGALRALGELKNATQKYALLQPTSPKRPTPPPPLPHPAA